MPRRRSTRLEGNLLLAENGPVEAEACYLKALDVAREPVVSPDVV
jgi:hypothetical protein